jgi:serine/threonine-protein kinase
LRAEKPEAFLQTPFTERNPSFSTDGRWVAYSSNESGLEQVYVKAFPDTGGKVPVSNAGGRQPTWSPNASELFFRSEDNRVMVASYTVVGDVFRSENPRVWSERRLANVGLNGTYDVAQDGKRIAALMPVEGATQQGRTHVVYIENFFDELRRLAPPGKR